MKRIISAVLSLLLVTTSALAQEPAESSTYNLTLEDAIAMAYTDNPQLETNLYIQNGNKISYETARYQRYQMRNTIVNVSNGIEGIYLKNGYYENAAKVQWDLSILEYDKIRNKIAYDVTEAYYNCVLMDKLETAAENSYDMAVRNYKTVEAQYKLGLIAKLDFENAELSVIRAKNALDTNSFNREIALENLKILIHKDNENCTIVLSDDVDCSEYSSDVEADIQGAMETRYDLTALRKSAELADEYYSHAKVLGKASAAYNSGYASYMKANYDYDNTKKLITLSIRSTYNNILTSKAEMNTAEKSYNICQKKYQSDNMKYELGMITNLELTKSINDLYEAQTAFANAKVKYRLTVEKYKHEITLGL